MSTVPLGSPTVPIVIPADFTQAERDEIKASNPGAVLVLVTPATTVAQTVPADIHKDTWSTILDTIDGVLTYAGAAAASYIVSPALAPFVVQALKLGTAEARKLILGTPTVERWTLAMLQAEPAAVRPLP